MEKRRGLMMNEVILAQILKIFYLSTSPITFLVGIILLYDVNIFLRVEKFLNKAYGPGKTVWIKALERNRESLQVFLLKRRRLIGVICLLNSISVFIAGAILLNR